MELDKLLGGLSSATATTNAWAYGFLGLASYLLVVRLLRYRLRDGLWRKYGFSDRESLTRMTLDQAQGIQREIAQKEFPFLFENSLFFALFKTYSIETISKLLIQTGQLSRDENASKRVVDTTLIILELFLNNPQDPRTLDAIARMNYLHSSYRKSGKILDDDMLYTLALFALEPARWIDRFGYRKSTDLERCAYGVFWKDLGREMLIPYDALKPYKNGPYDDGLAWLEALEQWTLDYEKKAMFPSDWNKDLAKYTMDIALFNVPWWARGFASGVATALLEPLMRNAMKLGQPSWIHRVTLDATIGLYKAFVKYLCLPRPDWLIGHAIESKPDPVTGRLHHLKYDSHPWYVKPTFWTLWGPTALSKRLLFGIMPGDEGDKYQPEGYIIKELGPAYRLGKGEAEMEETRVGLRERRAMSGKCPMSLF